MFQLLLIVLVSCAAANAAAIREIPDSNSLSDGLNVTVKQSGAQDRQLSLPSLSDVVNLFLPDTQNQVSDQNVAIQQL